MGYLNKNVWGEKLKMLQNPNKNTKKKISVPLKSFSSQNTASWKLERWQRNGFLLEKTTFEF